MNNLWFDYFICVIIIRGLFQQFQLLSVVKYIYNKIFTFFNKKLDSKKIIIGFYKKKIYFDTKLDHEIIFIKILILFILYKNKHEKQPEFRIYQNKKNKLKPELTQIKHINTNETSIKIKLKVMFKYNHHTTTITVNPTALSFRHTKNTLQTKATVKLWDANRSIDHRVWHDTHRLLARTRLNQLQGFPLHAVRSSY